MYRSLYNSIHFFLLSKPYHVYRKYVMEENWSWVFHKNIRLKVPWAHESGLKNDCLSVYWWTAQKLFYE